MSSSISTGNGYQLRIESPFQGDERPTKLAAWEVRALHRAFIGFFPKECNKEGVIKLNFSSKLHMKISAIDNDIKITFDLLLITPYTGSACLIHSFVGTKSRSHCLRLVKTRQ
ncbi:hypothetical protein J7643_10945 [bacterium]|nr:hypothetical protein [bacterium]